MKLQDILKYPRTFEIVGLLQEIEALIEEWNDLTCVVLDNIHNQRKLKESNEKVIKIRKLIKYKWNKIIRLALSNKKNQGM